MGCRYTFTGCMSVLAKVLCIAVLVLQSALLDYIIIKLDTKASTAGRYVWIALDSIVVIFWIIAMVFSYRFFNKPRPKKVPEEGFSGKDIIKTALLKELPFSYVSWLLYSIVLVVKINRMFFSFAEKLTSQDETLLSNTSLKIILSLAGVIFALLAYAHHDEAHNTKYKLLIEKLGTAVSIDLLDCIMLLDILFVVDNGIQLTFRFDHVVRAFSSICILLPVFPLLALRVMSATATAKNDKIFSLVMVLNNILYIVLVNIPLLGIRLFLWFHHDVDVTTFLTKNVMAIFKGLLDIYKELIEWRRSTSPQEIVQMEPVGV
ncbi:uncharacterized protein LOC117306968 [Asterias rubens]|uniref:uncharacterized protein LOC117306968 n=1 Tax=Asterias rubens TaxID=7604 RepID=UPI001455B1EF|nr:uncharacterized protein LOC117306968 [Asterias rubens]